MRKPKFKIESKVPLLLCIPVFKRGDVIEKLGEYQEEHYGLELEIDLKAPEPIIPEIPTEDITEEILNEMSKAPSHQARVK